MRKQIGTLSASQEEKKQAIEAAREAVSNAQEFLDSLESNCEHLMMKVHDSAHCAICDNYFGWWCPDSKDHQCHYNDEEDPMRDDCLFCHQPEERK